MASNCRFPKVGTDSSQPGNHRLPLQRTSGSPSLELTVANVGTTGTDARNCRFPEVGTPGFQPGNHRLPLQATTGSQTLKLTLPNLGTKGSHRKHLSIVAAQRFELTFSNLSGYHCKELRAPKAWNSISPWQLGGWGWSHPNSSGPGNFLYKMTQLNLQNGVAWKLSLLNAGPGSSTKGWFSTKWIPKMGWNIGWIRFLLIKMVLGCCFQIKLYRTQPFGCNKFKIPIL